MGKRELFLKYFKLAEKKFGKDDKRLAGEGWKEDWKTLIATIYSAQSRDEVTIVVMEAAFAKLNTLEKYASASVNKIEKLTRRINFYKNKSRNSKKCAQMLLKDYNGNVPDEIDELVKLPGVGRKTANLIISEIHNKDGICVDTHVHRLSNVLGIVSTERPEQTEYALMKIAPKKYWSRINRLFVLWGKSVRGRDKKKILAVLEG